jgi:hypothetical protein
MFARRRARTDRQMITLLGRIHVLADVSDLIGSRDILFREVNP